MCVETLVQSPLNNMSQITRNSTQDDPDLEQIDHVIRLFQKARKSQSKQNIKLTLGLKNGEEFFVYLVYPAKKASRKRNRKSKPSVVPVPEEETVELAEESTFPPPTSAPPPLPQMETRQRKDSNNKTPEQTRSPQATRANTSVLSPSSIVPLQYAVPTKNRFQNLPDILDEDSSKESDEEHTDGKHSDAADSDRESVSSFSNCKCENECNNKWHCKTAFKCKFSCVCECMTKENPLGPDSRHTCRKCHYFRVKFKNQYPNKLNTYAEITKIQK